MNLYTLPSKRNTYQAATMLPDNPQQAAQSVADTIPTSGAKGRRTIDYRHPDYDFMQGQVTLFRDSWVGGQEFVSKYLKTYSLREDATDFAMRKEISPCPAIAKGAVTEIKNTISGRLNEIQRKGGSASYQTAVVGGKFGVDRLGSSMNNFIIREILPELLAMGRVGVLVDRGQLSDNRTQLDVLKSRPYIYAYKREDILAWVPDESSDPNQYTVLLLRENVLDCDPVTGLPICWSTRYRYMRKMKTGGVQVIFYNNEGKVIDTEGTVTDASYNINLTMMPFVMFELSESLLTDIAMFQVGLLNMDSSDLSYTLKANFPFYVEQSDPRNDTNPLKTAIVPDNRNTRDLVLRNQNQISPVQETAKEDINVGITTGRRYTGDKAPEFINPSAEPLMASMKKQDQYESRIRKILMLWLSDVASENVDIAQNDQPSTEAGFKNIGVELEHGERRILAIWSDYDKFTGDGTVSYPNQYTNKTDEERLKEAKEILELKSEMPSPTWQKTCCKDAINVRYAGKLSDAEIKKMYNEIDTAATMTCNAEEIAKDMENGLVGNETASIARGYPVGEAAKAQVDMAKRLALVQAAQSADGALKNPGARGADGMPGDASLEKKISATKADGTPDSTKQRGKGAE